VSALEACIAYVEHEHDGDEPRDVADARAELARLRGIERAVDVTLIDSTLALSPSERLRQNDRMLVMILKLRDAFASH
jgi:hypothetical protein